MRLRYFALCAAAAVIVSAAPVTKAQTASGADVICKAGKTVAASVYGLWTGSGGGGGSDGDPTLVQYSYIVTNIGNAWNGNTEMFSAPCSGAYTVSLSLVRDSVSTTTDCGPNAGTNDDIYVQVWRQPVGGGDPKRIGNGKGAWAGVTGADTPREGASYAVSTHLDQGDQLYTLVLSDGGKFRCLASANLDIHKIGR